MYFTLLTENYSILTLIMISHTYLKANQEGKEVIDLLVIFMQVFKALWAEWHNNNKSEVINTNLIERVLYAMILFKHFIYIKIFIPYSNHIRQDCCYSHCTAYRQEQRSPTQSKMTLLVMAELVT